MPERRLQHDLRERIQVYLDNDYEIESRNPFRLKKGIYRILLNEGEFIFGYEDVQERS